MEKLSRLALSASAAVAIATPVGLAAAPPAGAAIAAKSLPCHATMSNSHPADYTTTDVRVKTAARAYVTTIAHYRTVNRKYHRRRCCGGDTCGSPPQQRRRQRN